MDTTLESLGDFIARVLTAVVIVVTMLYFRKKAQERSAASVAGSEPSTSAACWICFDGDPDENGKPIVRDCSCHGEDAGFAHLSCLIKYAETKSRGKLDEGRGRLTNLGEYAHSATKNINVKFPLTWLDHTYHLSMKDMEGWEELQLNI